LKNIGLFFLVLALCIGTLSCKKTSEDVAHSPVKKKPIPPEFPRPATPKLVDDSASQSIQAAQALINSLHPQSVAQWEQELFDRRELVWPAPEGFHPQVEGRKLALKLVPLKTIVRTGDSFWYRLELQNVGSEVVKFNDSTAFFRGGPLGSGKFDVNLEIRQQGGKRVVLLSPIGLSTCFGVEWTPPIPGWGEMGDDERKEAFRRFKLKSKVASALQVRLLPGETLFTRPVRFVSSDEECKARPLATKPSSRVRGRFRELRLAETRLDPGTYLIRAVYDGTPRTPPSMQRMRQIEEKLGFSIEEQQQQYEEEIRESIGLIESNSIEVEVVR